MLFLFHQFFKAFEALMDGGIADVENFGHLLQGQSGPLHKVVIGRHFGNVIPASGQEMILEKWGQVLTFNISLLWKRP
jgi:hypothetical protein